MLRICIDIDGCICTTKRPDQSYADVDPLPGAVETIQRWKSEGYYIILDTARHMVTCSSNVGRVIALQGKTLFEWLDKWKIPYDEIHFGKPYADVYIDDKAIRLESWIRIGEQIP